MSDIVVFGDAQAPHHGESAALPYVSKLLAEGDTITGLNNKILKSSALGVLEGIDDNSGAWNIAVVVLNDNAGIWGATSTIVSNNAATWDKASVIVTNGGGSKFLSDDGNYYAVSGGSDVGGSDTQVQFNDDGALGASAGFTYVNGVVLTAQDPTHKPLKIYGAALQSANIVEVDVNGVTGGKSLRVSATGRTYIGVNTLTPSNQRLFVEGTALDTMVATFQNPSGYAINIASYSGYAIFSGGTGASTFMLLNDTSYSFYVGGVRKQYITTSGAGFNVSSVDAAVHARGRTTTSRAGIFQAIASQNPAVNVLDIWNSSGTTVAGFDQNGRLAIGHSTPTAELDVDGDVRFRDLPTSDTGLATGRLYIDTAANIESAGNKVVGIKQ